MRGESQGLREARQAREEAEARLAHAEGSVVIPLRDLHRDNHVSARLDQIVRRAAIHRYRRREGD